MGILHLEPRGRSLLHPADGEIRAAFHEAGHAVAALLHGVGFRYVSIQKKAELIDGCYVSVVFEGVRYSPEHARQRNQWMLDGEIPESELMISLAGMVAESLLVRKFDAACRAGGSSDTQRLAIAMSRRLGGRLDEVEDRLEWKLLVGPGIERCLKLLAANWRAVDRLACALIEQRLLGLERAQELVGEGGLPGPGGR